MGLIGLDHVVIVVDDLDAAKAFFLELGMEVEGEMPIEGKWVDRVNALDDLRIEIVMLRTPDGHGKLEVTKFHHPPVLDRDPADPPNTLGLRSVMFAVTDVHDTVERLRAHGGELIGEIVRYEDAYLLCYLRGPGGMIVALAQPLG